MGDWVPCPITLRPSLTGTLMLEAGLYAGSETTSLHTVAIDALGFTVQIVWIDNNVWSPVGGTILRAAESGDPGLDGPYWHYRLSIIGVDDPMLGAEVEGSGGPQDLYVGQVATPASVPIEVSYTLSAGMILLRQHVTNPPASRGLRYWWDCDLLDGWAIHPESWFEAAVSGPGGDLSLRYRYPDYELPTAAAMYSPGTYRLRFGNDDPYLQTFAGAHAVYGRITALLGAVGLDQSTVDEPSGTGWTISGDSEGVEVAYAGEGINGFASWEQELQIPAAVDPQLEAYDVGDPLPDGRTDPVVVIADGSADPPAVAIGALAPLTVPAGTAITVDTDEDWAREHDECASVTRDGEGEAALPTSATNLPWKLDGAPPSKGVGEPYFTGAAQITKWSWLGILTGRRSFAARGDVPPEHELAAEQTVDAEAFWAANVARWTADGGALAHDRPTEALTATAAGTAPLVLTRTLHSYWPDRQAGAVSIPECYRVTSANYYWPTEPSEGGTTEPEDFYDWAALRYLALKVAADRYPLTLALVVRYRVPTVSDNHLSGSIRAEEYTVGYSAGEVAGELTVTAAGWYALDLWSAWPRPRIVDEIEITVSGLATAETITIGPLGVSQDLPTVDRPEPDTGHCYVKWLQDWAGAETMMVARGDGLPAVDVLDRYRVRSQPQGLPSIDWLTGYPSGVDLSRALTAAEEMALLAVQEGWSASWSTSAWQAETSSGGRDLSGGYPWDVRWTGGDPVTSDTDLQSCVGVRSWQVAGGLVYALHGRQFYRGRLDGLLTAGGAVQRATTGVRTTGNGLAETRDSDGHGAWWTPAIWQADGATDDPLSYALATLEGAAWVTRRTVGAGAQEWIWIGDLAQVRLRGGNLVRLRAGAQILTRDGYVWTRQGGAAAWTRRRATTADVALLLHVEETDEVALLDDTVYGSLRHGRDWSTDLPAGVPASVALWRPTLPEMTEARISVEDALPLAVGRNAAGSQIGVVGLVGDEVVVVGTVSPADALIWPWIYRLANGRWVIGTLAGGYYREWRSTDLDGADWTPHAAAAVSGTDAVTATAWWRGRDGSELVAGYHTVAGQVRIWERGGPGAIWSGPYLSAAAPATMPYVYVRRGGMIEVGWMADGTWQRRQSERAAGSWSVI